MHNSFIINPKYQMYDEFVRSIPFQFERTGKLIYDSRNQVRLFDMNGQTLVVKRFKVPMLHQRIDYTFIRPSKAKRAYLFALRLAELDISTPDPIACVETYRHGLFYYGYFVSAFCGDPDARFLREDYVGHDDLIDAIVRFIVDMNEKGFIHGDMNLSNFLYRKDSENKDSDKKDFGRKDLYRKDSDGSNDSRTFHDSAVFHITTIDINRSHFCKHPSTKQCLDSMIRLTHVRPLLRTIVMRYAELRGWDAKASADYVEHKLAQFERRKALKREV